MIHLGILRLWQQIRRWLALKEMGGFNPFYSPSLAWREASEEAMIAMKDAMLDEGKKIQEGIATGIKPISHRHLQLMIDLIDWRRGGY